MKKTSGYLPLIAVAGGLLLIASALLFKLPVFGWIILVIMAALFFFSIIKYRQHLIEVETEMDQMDNLESSGDYQGAKEGTQLYSRIQQLKKMNSEGRKIDPQVFSNILSARESARVALPGGNTLVVLGLLGTFYGLIQVVSQAGGLIQGESLSSLDSVIEILFKDMRGIFGTTLFGLAASMLLNLAQQVWQRTQMRFMARVEEFTQLHLLPAYSVEEEHPVLPALFQLKDEIVGLRDQLGGNWSELVEDKLGHLESSLSSTTNNVLDGIKASQLQSETNLKVINEEWSKEQANLIKSSTESGEKVFKSFIDNAEETQNSILSKISEVIKEQANSSSTWAEKVAKENSALINDQLQNSSEVLAEIKGGLESQLKELKNNLAGIPEVVKDMNEGMQSSISNFMTEVSKQNQEGAVELQDRSEKLLASLQENAQSIQSTVQDELQSKLMGITDSFAEVGQLAKENLGAGSEQLKSMQDQIGSVTQSLSELTGNLAESGTLMKVNQAELQSVMEMFTTGVNQLIESFGQQDEVEEDKQNLFDQIEKVLSGFQERSSDILQENALKTQEILMEVLQRVTASDIKD